jgi:hypothetical protein
MELGEHVGPVVGTPTCLYHHQGVLLSGQMQVETDAGAVRLLGPGEAFDIPPGHDARVVGDEPAVSIEFTGVRSFGKAPEVATWPVKTACKSAPASTWARSSATQTTFVAWPCMCHAHCAPGGPEEVLISEAAVSLLVGSGLSLQEAGEHELKGLPGRRPV